MARSGIKKMPPEMSFQKASLWIGCANRKIFDRAENKIKDMQSRAEALIVFIRLAA